MILRKPYAFLIKHFKQMHLILTVCMIYLIYRTELMISFLNEYINSVTSVIGQPIVSSLYNMWVIILPILILAFSVVLLITMRIKDKPRTYYILMIVAHIVIIATYFYGYTVFDKMQKTIVDLRTVNALRDLLIYCIVIQGIFSVVSLVRGVGFDVKKFDFGSDLDGLELTEEDNAEFEIDIDFDINDKTRKGKRYLRLLKYKYKENKFIAHIIMGALAAVAIFYVYNNFNIYNKTSPEGVNFNMNGFTMGVSKSYLLNQNSIGYTMDDPNKYLVVVELNVKNNSRNPAAFATGNIELNINGINYHHAEKYESMVVDLGYTYKNQEINNKDFSKYLLIYEIPANRINSKLKLGFHNSGTGETAYVRLNPKNISAQDKETKEYTLGDTMTFEGSTLGNTTLKIDSYELRNKFTLRYRYCSTRLKNCVDSVEYVKPSQYNTNYEKTLLRLDMDFKFDENFKSNSITNVYNLIKNFMKIEYEIDGQKKTQTVYLGSVTSRVASKNSYYIEVFQEIKVADKITLVFQVRNNIYRYSLK